MEPLTEGQERVMRAILEFLREEERPPTNRELAGRLGCHVKTVYQYLLALERKGCIERRKGRIRVAPELREDQGIPIVGRVAAGVPIMALANREGVLSLERMFGEGEVFAVRVEGDSMRDAGILDGDLAIVERRDAVSPGDIAVCYVGAEQAVTVKRLCVRGDGFELRPENDGYQPLRIPKGDPDFRVGGPVVGVVRRMP